MDDPRTPVENRPVEVINTGEELLLRAKVVARQIQERVWRAMEGHGVLPPHTPEDRREVDEEARPDEV
jgi:hypothetical protein